MQTSACTLPYPINECLSLYYKIVVSEHHCQKNGHHIHLFFFYCRHNPNLYNGCRTKTNSIDKEGKNYSLKHPRFNSSPICNWYLPLCWPFVVTLNHRKCTPSKDGKSHQQNNDERQHVKQLFNVRPRYQHANEIFKRTSSNNITAQMWQKEGDEHKKKQHLKDEYKQRA